MFEFFTVNKYYCATKSRVYIITLPSTWTRLIIRSGKMAEEKGTPAVKKKKSKYYYYVNSQSDEADTLKDKFWRNLEEGKIDVMHTPDLYSKVKCNKKQLGLSVSNVGNAESPVSTLDCSPSSSCGGSTKSISASFSVSGYETGSLLSNSPMIDSPMHSPFRGIGPDSGQPTPSFDSSTTSAVASGHNVWEELDRSTNDVCSSERVSDWDTIRQPDCDAVQLSTVDGSTEPTETLPDTDDTLDCSIEIVENIQESGGQILRSRRLRTKRRRNEYSRRKSRTRSARLTSKESSSDMVALSSSAGKAGKAPRKRKKRQTYDLVPLESEKADTRKDPFWKGLEKGELIFSEADMYSKVKTSRKVNQWCSRTDAASEDASSVASSSVQPDASLEQGLGSDAIHPEPEVLLVNHVRRRRGRRGRQTCRSNSPQASAVPDAYLHLVKQECCLSDNQEKLDSSDRLLLSSDELPKPESSSRLPSGSETAANEIETRLSASSTVSDQFSADKSPRCSAKPCMSSGDAQNKNDSKLLATCEVTVKRLRTEKIRCSEGCEAVAAKDDTTANCSVTETHETETEQADAVPLPGAPSTEPTNSETFDLSVASAQEFNYDDIDFDLNNSLDDICSLDVSDLPDILGITSSEGVLRENQETVSLVPSVTPFPCASDSTSQPSSCAALLQKPSDSEVFLTMKTEIQNHLDSQDANWEKSFVTQWGSHIEGAFESAILSDDLELANTLLGIVPSSLNCLEKRNSTGMTFLMEAVQRGHIDLTRSLIRHGALVNSQDPLGNTPLVMSSRKGDLKMASLLLDSGAHIDLANSKGETPLIVAVAGAWLELINLLLLNGANFALTNCDGQTVMQLARINERNDVLQLLTSHINQLTRAFQHVITETLRGVGELVSTLFPLHCFSLRDATTFRLNFTYDAVHSRVARPILFIGHALIGNGYTHCLLHGPRAVDEVTINGQQLLPLSLGLFILPLHCVSNGQNELVIRTVLDPSSKMKLLVCAYSVKPKQS